jgi:hypothetical protein
LQRNGRIDGNIRPKDGKNGLLAFFRITDPLRVKSGEETFSHPAKKSDRILYICDLMTPDCRFVFIMLTLYAMQFVQIDLTRLRNEEWFAFYSELWELIPVYGAQTMGVDGLLALMEPLYLKANRGLATVRKSFFTEEMREASLRRNRLFSGFYSTVKAARILTAGQEDADAAERLFILLTHYRKLALNRSYTEESAATLSLLQDLQGKHAADVTALGLARWVESLHLAEQKYVAYRTAQMQEDLKKPVEKLRNTRIQMDALYKSLTQALYSRLLADGLGGDKVVDPNDLKTGTYDDDVPPERRGNVTYNFVIAWNEIVRKHLHLLAVRAGFRAKRKHLHTPASGDRPEE